MTSAAYTQTIVRTQTIAYTGNPPNSFTPANFGMEMAVSGDWLAILATSAPDGGSLNIPFGTRYPVFVYQLQSLRWEPVAVLSEPITQNVTAGSMTLSGSRIVHGIPNLRTDAGASAGAVWSYVADPVWHRQAEIHSPEPREGAFFGSDVALEGDMLAVAALGSGVVPSRLYLYSFAQGTWTHMQTLAPRAPFTRIQSVTINPDWLAAVSFENSGAVFLYQRTSSEWELRQTLVPPSGGTFGGQAAAITTDMLVVASARESIGRVYVYKLDRGEWSLSQQLDASDRAECTYLGSAISMTSHKLLVGASSACINGQQNAGLARLYVRAGDTWAKAADLTDGTPAQGEVFAGGVAVGPNHIFMNGVTSESNFTRWQVDVYGVPANPSRRRRAVRP